MLKHLGENGIIFLTNIFNCSINHPSHVEDRKAADKVTSYRPIFLLSPSAKILESIMLARIQESIVLEEHQNGFRKGQSTATALQQITGHIKTGLKKKKPMDRTNMSVKSVRRH